MDIINSDQLEKMFYIHLQEPEKAVFSMNAADMLNEDNMQSLVSYYGSHMKAIEDTAPAAYLASWFGGLALALQYTASLHNMALDFSLRNISVHIIPDDGYVRIAFQLHERIEEKAPELEADRPAWRERVFSSLYGDTLRPLFEQLSETTKLNAGQLWGQLPTKFNYYMDGFEEATSELLVKERLADDYRFLKLELNPAVFGRSKNPFDVKIRFVEHILEPDKQVRMKNACCRYIYTEGGTYCYTCPRMKEEERAEKRESYRARVGSAK
ncbi:IucA/IucC family C-terminal-domain containing protein [Paenibacillus eucommiae]|uniref:Ferric iron reductase protein FhuF n=1 Tax=Paenibacillus eucommiae TaxID=1355755 RepID=A0ABS4IR57_9BACL|nr:IucA/IucC family C-terminal-domain containing protein [Paenibacillus eucommiae]MBP1990020.1 ferric iron reductase protein FhuF [Paenibacillus eucommiae]